MIAGSNPVSNLQDQGGQAKRLHWQNDDVQTRKYPTEYRTEYLSRESGAIDGRAWADMLQHHTCHKSDLRTLVYLRTSFTVKHSISTFNCQRRVK